LRHGYATLGGERGVKLSGGERAVFGAGPALLSDAPILIYRRLFERQVASLTQAENA
jgi:ABC-type transport system involved in Fe-S cluster assembly fused permease/ATPase subunit